MDEDDQPARHRVQVVVAHPDDETFGCGSLLLHAAAAGARTAVCCATRGEAGEIAGGFRPVDLGVVRERELRDAAALLGVDQVDLLEFRDSGMAGRPGRERSLARPSRACAMRFRRVCQASGPTSSSRSMPATGTVTTPASVTLASPLRVRPACRGSTCSACPAR